MSDSIVAGASTSPARAATAVVRHALARVSDDWRGPSLKVSLPSGEIVRAGPPDGGEIVSLRIRNYRALSRLVAAGDIGFAEGYMAGDWDTPDLPRLLTVLAVNFDGWARLGVGGPLARVGNWLQYLFRRNTLEGSRKNIHAHYDLGNAFYAAWLDPGMTYSSALFDGPDQTLEAAQARKYGALAEAIDLRAGQRVLEIGCGWGGFAEFAAREVGATVVGLTISPAQHEYARRRIQDAGLSDRVDIRLCDYREARGRFDRVVSIEMFEAVGESYWPLFFDRIRERLAPDGRAGLQIITIRDDMFEAYRGRIDFIRKHIFPGGMLPSETRLREEIRRAGLVWTSPRRFGLDYAHTLREWDERFHSAWSGLRSQGFDERFQRLWRFYLAYCEAGFATGRTDVIQLGLSLP